MNKKTKGLVAGVAGGALLLGAGGTFALWSDSANINGGTITAGTLRAEATSVEWYDVSPDRVNPSAELNIPGVTAWADLIPSGFSDPETPGWGEDGASVSTGFAELRDGKTPLTGAKTGDDWHIVPGDFMLGRSGITVTGHGDNLRANIRVNAVDETGAEISLPDRSLAQALGLHVVVLDEEGYPVGETVPVTSMIGTVIDFEDGGELEMDRQFTVVVIGNFPKDVADQNLQTAVADLSKLQVQVTQVRAPLSAQD